MMLMKKAVFMLLGAAASVSGRPDDDHCPVPCNPSQGELVDCGDISLSLDNLVQHITNDSQASSSAILTSLMDVGYDDLRHQYASSVFNTSPTFIVQPKTVVEVQATVKFASLCDFKVTPRSGGHSYLGISSCNGFCIQLDMGLMDDIEVVVIPETGDKQLNIGPGVNLEVMAEVCVQQGVFVPGGECLDIGLSGHMQTGGFGVWGRSFGAFANYVDSFKIVLADGSLHSVTKPQEKETSKLNDDLYYAVLGGASGSYGVIVEATLDTVKNDDYYSFYWEVNFLYDDSTLPGIKRMLRKYAETVGETEVQSDTRWGIFWTLIAAKTLLNASPTFGPVFPGQGFNYFQIDLAWAVPKTDMTESDALTEAQEFYDNIVDECTGCIPLNDYLNALPEDTTLQALVKENVKNSFASASAVSAPVSQLYKDLTLFDFDSFGVEDFPFTTSYQQGPRFPDEDAIEEILDRIDVIIPKIGNEPRFLVSQFATHPSSPHSDNTISLPFQDDVFGVAFDVWDLTGGQADYREALNHLQEHVMAALGGVDHRMFWSAYDDPCLECGDWEKYYESRPKYNGLVQIKRRVDPNNVFQNRMSMPLNPLNAE